MSCPSSSGEAIKTIPNSKRVLLILLLTALLTAAQAALSLEIPDEPKGRVSDYAGLLTGDQIASLDAKLEAFENETTNQIAVAIFKTLEGESLEDFSIRLAEKWKIGTRKDNGVILLVFVDDRKMRIEVGYGLEGALTDATSSSIIRNDIAPHFRQGDYYGGIEAGIQRIIEATKTEYKPESPEAGIGWILISLVMFVFLPLFILGWVIYKLVRFIRSHTGAFTFESGGSDPGRGYSGSGQSSGGGSWGGGGSSSDSFSGGGGSFGGGGASGRW